MKEIHLSYFEKILIKKRYQENMTNEEIAKKYLVKTKTIEQYFFIIHKKVNFREVEKNFFISLIENSTKSLSC